MQCSYTVDQAAYRAQIVNATREAREMHDKLIAAGARWDGVDSYDMTAAIKYVK